MFRDWLSRCFCRRRPAPRRRPAIRRRGRSPQVVPGHGAGVTVAPPIIPVASIRARAALVCAAPPHGAIDRHSGRAERPPRSSVRRERPIMGRSFILRAVPAASCPTAVPAASRAINTAALLRCIPAPRVVARDLLAVRPSVAARLSFHSPILGRKNRRIGIRSSPVAKIFIQISARLRFLTQA